MSKEEREKDRELLEFDGELVSMNIYLDRDEVEELKELWLHGVEGCQPPLVETHKNGLHLFIPWILKESS